jgi:hypothetical protein
MRSHEVLKKAADVIGVKALAAQLRLSPALVYKWCQEYDPDDPDVGGARNPLDRLAEVIEATGDDGVVNWICQQADGFFVPNSKAPAGGLGSELIQQTQKLVTEFSRLLTTVSSSIEDDGAIQPAEAKQIREAWESLKQMAEAFAVASEHGHFDLRADA